jgi:hypothetical protein
MPTFESEWVVTYQQSTTEISNAVSELGCQKSCTFLCVHWTVTLSIPISLTLFHVSLSTLKPPCCEEPQGISRGHVEGLQSTALAEVIVEVRPAHALPHKWGRSQVIPAPIASHHPPLFELPQLPSPDIAKQRQVPRICSVWIPTHNICEQDEMRWWSLYAAQLWG